MTAVQNTVFVRLSIRPVLSAVSTIARFNWPAIIRNRPFMATFKAINRPNIRVKLSYMLSISSYFSVPSIFKRYQNNE